MPRRTLHFRIPLAVVGFAVSIACARGAAGLTAKQFAELFRPDRTDLIALAPDGLHLAYTMREAYNLSLVIVSVERPQDKKTVFLGRDQTTGLFIRTTTAKAGVPFLRWSSPTRLVYALDVPDDGGRAGNRHEVRAMEVDGTKDVLLVNGMDVAGTRLGALSMSGDGVNSAPLTFFPRRPFVMGIMPDNPDTLLVEAYDNESHRSGATENFKVNLLTGRHETVEIEDSPGRFLYDQQGRARVFVNTPMLPNPDPDAPNRYIIQPENFQVRPLVQKQGAFSGFFRAWLNLGWKNMDTFFESGSSRYYRQSYDNYYSSRSFPIGFGRDPNVLFIASNVESDTFRLFGVDLTTKQRTDFRVESAENDLVDPGEFYSSSVLRFDRQGELAGVRLGGPQPATRWYDARLAALQGKADTTFRGRKVEIVDWDESRTRALLLVTGGADPGRYYVFNGERPDVIQEFLRVAPGLAIDALGTSTPFEFTTPDGVHLTGTMTMPRRARTSSPPLVVYCRDIPGERRQAIYNRDIQALAAMGCAVVQVNYRGSAGFGTKFRDAVLKGPDTVPIEDIRSTLSWILGRYKVDRRKIGFVGEGFGGYLAVRMLELYPDEYRCAVSINAPSEPEKWLREEVLTSSGAQFNTEYELRKAFFGRSSVDLSEISLVRNAGRVNRAVMIVQDVDKVDLYPAQGKRLRDALANRPIKPEYLEVRSDFTNVDPEARGEAFEQIQDFLISNIYEFDVEIGPLKVIP